MSQAIRRLWRRSLYPLLTELYSLSVTFCTITHLTPDTGIVLYRIGYTRIQRHTLIQGQASPDNPDFRDYFEQRAQRSKQIENHPKAAQRIIRQQQAKCPNCGQSLFNGEDIHIHHTIPRSQGGTNHSSNLVAVHSVCHSQLHR